MAEKIAAKQHRRGVGKPFQPGKSGNPAGKPIGARNKTTLALEKLLDGEAEAITLACIKKAKEGDGLALKLILERVAPLRRGRPVRFAVPALHGASAIVEALGGVLQAVGAGELTPEEGATVATIMETKRRAIELVEIEQRISKLEQSAERSR